METKFEPLFEGMTISLEEKTALQTSFDKAVIKKTTDMLGESNEKFLAEAEEKINEEYSEKLVSLEESLDGYLDTVVDDFIKENAPDYEAQINEEKVKTLLGMFDNMVDVVGMDMLQIKESKETRDLDEAYNSDEEVAQRRIQKLEETVADLADKLVERTRESDKYLQIGIVNETAEGLTILESAKFDKLADMVPFEKDSSYLDKLETIKESIVSSRSDDFVSESQFKNPGVQLPDSAYKAPDEVNVKDALDFGKYL